MAEQLTSGVADYSTALGDVCFYTAVIHDVQKEWNTFFVLLHSSEKN